jgi:hypothetical protein
VAPPPPSVPTPRAYPGFGAPPDPSVGPDEPQPWGAAPPSDPGARPPAVLWASVLTWVCTALAVLVMASSIAVLAADPGFVFDELRRQNPDFDNQAVSEQTLTTATYILGGAVIAWSLGAALLAVLVFRRVGWARVALVISAAQIFLALPLAASVVTLALLIRPDVRAWFD